MLSACCIFYSSCCRLCHCLWRRNNKKEAIGFLPEPGYVGVMVTIIIPAPVQLRHFIAREITSRSQVDTSSFQQDCVVILRSAPHLIVDEVVPDVDKTIPGASATAPPPPPPMRCHWTSLVHNRANEDGAGRDSRLVEARYHGADPTKTPRLLPHTCHRNSPGLVRGISGFAFAVR